MSPWTNYLFEPAMLELIAKLLVIIFLPLSAAIIWRIRTRATWFCLAIALCAISINYSARLFLSPVHDYTARLLLTTLLDSYNFVPMMFRPPNIMWAAYTVSVWIIYGLIREGIRWLLMRFAVRTTWSWNEGVFFGICYSILSIPLVLGGEIYDDITFRKLWHPSQIIPHLNYGYHWRKVFYETWDFVIPLITSNVGASLAVLLSVQLRKLWPLLIAILFYILSAIPMYFIIPLHSFLKNAGISLFLSLDIAYILPSFLFALPALWFILYIRKVGILNT